MAKFGKKNHVSINPLDYSLCLLGEAKCGKTTLIKEVCEKLTGSPDGYLFLEFGDERGAAAIENINFENVEAWWSDEDEDIVGFADIVDDICENKSTDYPDLKVVIWDTYDQIIPIAEDETIRLYNKTVPLEKRAETINAAWGGFGRGEKKAMELMWDMKNRLKKVGVETIIIGHVKTKDVTDTVTGEQYQVLTSDQQQNYFNALKKQLHFLALAYVDRSIIKEGKGKDAKGKITGETRKIKFRDEGYAIDAGSRFSAIVPEVPMTADAFIGAIIDAIKAEQSKSGKSFEETKAEQEMAEIARLKEIAEAEQRNKAMKEDKETLKEILPQINAYIQANRTNQAVMKPILIKLRELNVKKPDEITSLKDAKEILELIM